MLKIGEIAARAGVTVRTLRHYDEIGLLKPSHRSGAGYRLYLRADLERLTGIVALRATGLSLAEIRAVLDDSSFTLKQCLDLHLKRLDQQIRQQKRVRQRLLAIRGRLGDAKERSVDQLTQILEVIRLFEKYYTPEQLEKLRERRELVGEERMRQAGEEWNHLFAGFRDAMEKGLPPDDPVVQELSRKARALITEFSGGDKRIEQSLANMYRGEGAPKILGSHGISMDNSLWAYMARARQSGPYTTEEA